MRRYVCGNPVFLRSHVKCHNNQIWERVLKRWIADFTRRITCVEKKEEVEDFYYFFET